MAIESSSARVIEDWQDRAQGIIVGAGWPHARSNKDHHAISYN
jgi:hypothetical protein